jgi:hypothetical protein
MDIAIWGAGNFCPTPGQGAGTNRKKGGKAVPDTISPAHLIPDMITLRVFSPHHMDIILRVSSNPRIGTHMQLGKVGAYAGILCPACTGHKPLIINLWGPKIGTVRVPDNMDLTVRCYRNFWLLGCILK